MSLASVRRFWGRVDPGPPDACWEWKGFTGPTGYGQISQREPGMPATLYGHRISYELAYGPIEPGLEVDHLCYNRACVNPAHLEAVTPEENKFRAAVRHRRAAGKAGLPGDHGTPARYGRGCRCRTCKDAQRDYFRARHAKRLEPPQHGVLTAYTSYGCRCDLCRGAKRNYDRSRRVAASVDSFSADSAGVEKGSTTTTGPESACAPRVPIPAGAPPGAPVVAYRR